jgi:hypothetical protein
MGPYVPDTVHRENGVVWRSSARGIDGVHLVKLANESARPIQCRVTFGEVATADLVVHASESRTAMTFRNEPLPDSGALTSACNPVPTTVPPAPGAGSCSIEVTLANDPNDFYPPGPIRRFEQGVVLVDFDFRHDAPHVLGPVVVMSSGSSDLDNAALKLLKATRLAVHGCVGGRARRGISFVLLDDSAEPDPPDTTHLPVAPDEIIKVTGFRGRLSHDPEIKRKQ